MSLFTSLKSSVKVHGVRTGHDNEAGRKQLDCRLGLIAIHMPSYPLTSLWPVPRPELQERTNMLMHLWQIHLLFRTCAGACSSQSKSTFPNAVQQIWQGLPCGSSQSIAKHMAVTCVHQLQLCKSMTKINLSIEAPCKESNTCVSAHQDLVIKHCHIIQKNFTAQALTSQRKISCHSFSRH